jgi:inorganic pyrophosphatase
VRLDRISPFRSKHVVRVVLETPKGSRNKFDYDPDTRSFCLAKTLPEGMAFPFDFGFIPQTRGEDGDPLDILVLMDEPVFPGVIVPCRIIGLFTATQLDKGKRERNDRYVGAALSSLEHEGVKDIGDLPRRVLKQIETFFVTYNQEQGRKFIPEKIFGASHARKMIKASHRGL